MAPPVPGAKLFPGKCSHWTLKPLAPPNTALRLSASISRPLSLLSSEPAFDFEGTKAVVVPILSLDLATKEARELHSEQVYNALMQLNREIELVEQRANGYPANPIGADVWMAGAGHANLASALTDHFKAE